MIKGGRSSTRAKNLRGRRDVAIRYAVVALEPEIPGEQASYVLAADGKLVLPGLVDMHVHVFPRSLGARFAARRAGAAHRDHDLRQRR